jgi:hypothetical protein
MRRIDRSSAADAHFVLESLIPDAAGRLRWLGLLADATVAAHDVNPASWAVTLFDNGLRLNVGQIETVIFRPDGAMLVLDSGHFSDDEIAQIRMDRSLGRVSAYTYVQGTVNVDLPYDLGRSSLKPHDQVRAALLSLVERAAERVHTRTGYYRSHSPGVVEYVATVTGRRLREPEHGQAHSVRRRQAPEPSARAAS